MAISDTDAGMHIIQFKDAVKELAGGPDQSYLKKMCTPEQCTGESALIAGGYKPNPTAGADTALSSITNRYTLDAIGASPTAAQAIAALFTRNDDVESQRTQVLPREISVGKWFDTAEKNFLELTDPSSRKLKNLMQGYWTKQDLRVITALFASTTTRVANDASTPTTTASVSMPATQILPDTSLDAIDYKIFSAIKKRFMKQYVSGETIYACFDEDTWEALVNNSGDKLLNKDYVDSASHFMSGDLPTCFGVVPVVHPLFGNSTLLGTLLASGEQSLIGAFTSNGVAWAEFMAMETLMDVSIPAMKGQSVVSVKEFANAARIDDLRVVTGAVLSA